MSTQNGINAPLPLSATQGGLGVASPTAHGILVAEGGSAVNPIVLTTGQVLVGVTGSDPVPTTLSTLSVVNVTGTTQTIAPNTIYIANNASLVTFTLPATSSVGDQFSIRGSGAGGWTIAQNAGQTVNVGNSATTTGAGGSVSSSNRYDWFNAIAIVANTAWSSAVAQGNVTIV